MKYELWCGLLGSLLGWYLANVIDAVCNPLFVSVGFGFIHRLCLTLGLFMALPGFMTLISINFSLWQKWLMRNTWR